MTITTTSPVGTAVHPPGRAPLGITLPGLAFVPVSTSLWRVVATDGEVRGHIERRASADGERYAARLLLPGGVRSLPLGEFWSPRDAAACFR